MDPTISGFLSENIKRKKAIKSNCEGINSICLFTINNWQIDSLQVNPLTPPPKSVNVLYSLYLQSRKVELANVALIWY